MRTIGKLARLHLRKKVEVVFDASFAVRTFAPRLGQRSAIYTNLISGQVVYIRLAVGNKCDSPIVELLVVIRGMIFVFVPLEAEPTDVGLDRVDVSLFFLGWVSVVETQVTAPAELLCDTEVQTDCLGVADV